MAQPPVALMIQGTHSDAGKSLIVAGLCRLFARRGLRVRPFKPQNMSNNAAATPDGGEIGRAQALQARACFAAPSVHMNPVLLKPQSDTGAQVVLQGRVLGQSQARQYFAERQSLMPAVLHSFHLLAAEADLLLVEGAGSPAEVNLRTNDIANMGFAHAAGLPVLLLGDIERGGVIASLVGTKAVLAPADAALIRGFIVNKFRGDPALFEAGMARIEQDTGWPGLGLIPWLPRAGLLPAEDAMQIEQRQVRQGAGFRIIVPRFPRIANFDDLDPLASEADVAVEFIAAGRPLPQDADLILLPGSKTTIADLVFMREQGWDIDLLAHHRQGKPVFGICGGYQMLGRWIDDPLGLEGAPGRIAGLGLLDLETSLDAHKIVGPMQGETLIDAVPVQGYEIHAGRSLGTALAQPLLRFADGRLDGAVSADGLVAGCYLHGLFASDAFRRHFLAQWRPERRSQVAYELQVEAILDELAAHLEQHLDADRLLALAAPLRGHSA